MMIRGGTVGDNKYVKLEQRYIHDQRWNTCIISVTRVGTVGVYC